MRPSLSARPGWIAARAAATLGGVALLLASAAAQPTGQPDAPDDPWVGSWRGTAARPDGGTAPVLLTIVTHDGAYRGFVSGFEEGTELPLSTVTSDGDGLVVEARADSAAGELLVRYELRPGDPGLVGIQRYVLGGQAVEFPVELRRRRRLDVPQPQVDQRLDYFLGDWSLDYTGGEFPPLSLGTRTARLTFSRIDESPFAVGRVSGDAWGEPYQETIIVGFDEASEVLVFRETLWNGVELLSLGNWQSPIAINFVTRPVEADGSTYQLRRRFSITSEASFLVTDEFSVNGEPYRRMGNGTYSRVP